MDKTTPTPILAAAATMPSTPLELLSGLYIVSEHKVSAAEIPQGTYVYRKEGQDDMYIDSAKMAALIVLFKEGGQDTNPLEKTLAQHKPVKAKPLRNGCAYKEKEILI